jgi:hypothetical protein
MENTDVRCFSHLNFAHSYALGAYSLMLLSK